MTNETVSPALNTIKTAFDFTVDKFPLSGPDNMTTPCYGLFRNDTGQFLGSSSVTKVYVPHTTDDVLALSEAVDTAFEGTADVKCHFQNGHYVLIEPSKDMRRSIFGEKDNLWPRFMVRGGYGGNGGSFACSIGMYHDICLNLSMLRSVSETSVNIRHTGGLRDQMDSLIETVGHLRNGWDSLIAAVERMESHNVLMGDFLTQLYPVKENSTPRELTIHRNRTKAIVRRLLNEHTRAGRTNKVNINLEVTGWQAYNAVQGYVQHEASRRKSATEFSRILSANREKVVENAEILALAG